METPSAVHGLFMHIDVRKPLQGLKYGYKSMHLTGIRDLFFILAIGTCCTDMSHQRLNIIGVHL
jgi:hypothetical protein